MNEESQINVEREDEINIQFPWKVSQLINDKKYQTDEDVATAVSAEAELREAADSSLSDRIDGKQNTLTAGTNITIDNDTISGSPLYDNSGQNTDGAMTQKATSDSISNEATARESGDNNLQGQIDAISASSDVTDIVGTYAALQSYDTSKLTDKAIIKVLSDENEGGATTYYRWSTTSETFTLIGSEGPYYTKSQSDTLIGEKLDKTTTFWGRTAQNGTVSGPISLGGDKIMGVGAGVSETDAVNKGQLDLKQDKIDDPINARLNGVMGDGVTDDTIAIQSLIDNHPYSTIFFPTGTYLISAPLVIKTENSKAVDLLFDGHAVLKSSAAISSLIEVGTNIATWDRYARGAIVRISGGVLDASNTQQAILISANRKLTELNNIVIQNAAVYGINIQRSAGSTSASADCTISGCTISGNGSENNSIGILIDAYDNRITNLFVSKTRIGIQDNTSNYYNNIHVLGSWTESPTSTDYDKTVGMQFNGAGVCSATQIYMDTVATCLEITNNLKMNLANIQSYWYMTDPNYTTTFIKMGANATSHRLSITNAICQFPSSGTNIGLDISAQNQGAKDYFGAYSQAFYKFVNFNISNLADENDYLFARCLYPETSYNIRNPWSKTMTQNRYYPIAIINRGIHVLGIRMANDQVIDAAINVDSTPSADQIKIRNLYDNAHHGEYTLALCNPFTKDGVTQRYLCVKSSSSNASLNACIFSGTSAWNTVLKTSGGIDNIDLGTPTVTAEKHFNPELD